MTQAQDIQVRANTHSMRWPEETSSMWRQAGGTCPCTAPFPLSILPCRYPCRALPLPLVLLRPHANAHRNLADAAVQQQRRGGTADLRGVRKQAQGGEGCLARQGHFLAQKAGSEVGRLLKPRWDPGNTYGGKKRNARPTYHTPNGPHGGCGLPVPSVPLPLEYACIKASIVFASKGVLQHYY